MSFACEMLREVSICLSLECMVSEAERVLQSMESRGRQTGRKPVVSGSHWPCLAARLGHHRPRSVSVKQPKWRLFPFKRLNALSFWLVKSANTKFSVHPFI